MLIIEMNYNLYRGIKAKAARILSGINIDEYSHIPIDFAEIPAYINADGQLVLGHNGESYKNKHFSDFSNLKAEDFVFFCDHKYQGAKLPTKQYLYNGIPFELMKVWGTNNELIYTFLWPVRSDTYFCECKDCEKKYVIDCYESPLYHVRELTMPTIRCKDCRRTKKQKSA